MQDENLDVQFYLFIFKTSGGRKIGWAVVHVSQTLVLLLPQPCAPARASSRCNHVSGLIITIYTSNKSMSKWVSCSKSSERGKNFQLGN
jgi:hypothetical protein